MSGGNGNAAGTGAAGRLARVSAAGRWLCLAGATVSAVALVGWLTGNEHLYIMVRGQPPTMPNSALALALVGAAGAMLGDRRPSRGRLAVWYVASFVAAAIGIGTLVQYALAVDLHIDRIVVDVRGGRFPGRPSPLTALGVALLGLAALTHERRRAALVRPSEWLLIAAALTGIVGVLAQLIGAADIARLPRQPGVGMAVPAAVSLLLVSAGLAMSRPGQGIMALALSAGPGGIMLRRLTLPFMLVPLLLGFGVTRLLTMLDVEQFPLVIAALDITLTSAGIAVIVLTARLLDRSNARLEASRARAREVVALASDGIFIADLEGRFTEVNEAGCRMLGIREDEIVGKAYLDFIDPDEAERLATVREYLLAGNSEIGEWHLRHRDGRYVAVEVSARMLPGNRWLAFARDIGVRKAAEEEVRRSKARIDGIVSIAADAIISVDESQRLTIFNRAAERIFGWTAGEVLGRPLDVLLPERFRDVHRQHVRRFATDPAEARPMAERAAVIRGLRKDGTEFAAEAAISKLRLGDELTFTVVLRDVTREQRRSTQDRLLSSIGLLLTSSLDREHVVNEVGRLLVREFADACVLDIVLEPGASPAMTRSVLYRDARRGDAENAPNPVPVDRLRSHLASATLQTRRPVLVARVTPEYLESISQSAEHRRLLEELAPASVVSAPLQARDALLGVLTLVSSDPRRLYDEEDVAFAEAVAQRLALAIDNARLFTTATNAVSERDEVLRIVAHDLRNPLGLIMMRASLLQEGSDGADGKRRASVTAIETAAKRMNRLIRDLLDVTSAEAGYLPVHCSRTAVRELVQEAAAAQQTHAAEAKVALRTELPDDLPDVHGDRDRLLQVFENLIGNAIKFTPEGRGIVLGAESRGDEVVFRVTDAGEGIAEDELPHIFDRFWQARRNRRVGAGLGLSIVKALVEAHGGYVTVESVRGAGSTFAFSIPVARPDTARRPAGAPPPGRAPIEPAA